MDEPFYFEDIQIGQEWTSRARTVTETDVVNFAGITGDFDPLHTDHHFASKTPFGRPIAHGLLGLSFVAGLGSFSPAMHTVAFVAIKDWHFVKPIHFGDTVHVKTKVVDKQPQGRKRGVVTWHRQLVNHRDEVVQEGTFETLVAIAPKVAPRKPHMTTKKTDATVSE